MQGAGNDYLFFDMRKGSFEGDFGELSKTLSDRHFGIGSDGIVLIKSDTESDVSMRIFNSDGSEGTTCGNALRCIGKYLFDSENGKRSDFSVGTLSGSRFLEVTKDGMMGTEITVSMGTARPMSSPFYIRLNDAEVEVIPVFVGNTHAVVFCDDLSDGTVGALSGIIAKAPIFRDGVNIEFCAVTEDGSCKARVVERGSGETLSCGSGACAIAFVSAKSGRLQYDSFIRINMKGGTLFAKCDKTGNVTLKGGADYVFFATVEIPIAAWNNSR